MKILYAVQATGNGHLSRATEVIPFLKNQGEVDVFVSGTQSDIALPFPISSKKHGLSFVFGKDGTINFSGTLKIFKPTRLIWDIVKTKLDAYDLIINDFEPVTAWACKLRGRNSISMSHQSSFNSDLAPRPPERSLLSEKVLKYYAPASQYLGLHFQAYDEHITTPIIRRGIRSLIPTSEDHIAVYLPAYCDSILMDTFSKVKETQFTIFSRNCITPYQNQNIKVYPVGISQWEKYFASASGVIMGAGFEGPSEALFMGKKLMVIPMINQYEQVCNSIALKHMGIHVVNRITSSFPDTIRYWLKYGEAIKINFPDHTSDLVSRVVSMNLGKQYNLKSYSITN